MPIGSGEHAASAASLAADSEKRAIIMSHAEALVAGPVVAR